MYRSDGLKGKVHVNKFSWLKVTGINCFVFVDSCHFLYVADFAWCFFFLKKMFW